MTPVIGIPNSPEAQSPEATAATVREQIRAEAIEQARVHAEMAKEQARAVAEQVSVRVGTGGVGQGGTGRGEPVVIVPSASRFTPDIPHRLQEVYMTGLFLLAFVIVAFPIARAIGRWLDRRHRPVTVPPELSAQLSRMETAIEAMQIEVERVAEAQRYMARLAAEQQRELSGGTTSRLS